MSHERCLGRRRLALLATGSLAVFCALLVPPARAADETSPPVAVEPAEDLFAELLAAEGDGAWRGVLNRIRKEKDGTWIGQVLGGLFRDRVRYADKSALVAYAAAYLADHPEPSGKVLLGHDIVRRAFRDPDLLATLRRHLTAGEGGWERLLGHARELLRSDDLQGRAVGAWFLSREDGAAREAVRGDLLRQAKADLPRLGSGEPGTRELASCYLDAFDALLAFRFATVDDAVTVLEELSALDLAALVRELSRRKDLPTTPAARKLVDYGRRLVDAAAVAGSPEQLEEFLDPARTPMRAVRRYAMQKAAALGPRADAAWARLLARVITDEDDVETLRGALDVLERVGFADQLEPARLLATALARRLIDRGPSGLRERDPLDDRVRMARAFGVLRARVREMEDLVHGGTAAIETPVAVEVVRALGSVPGVTADEVIGIYRAQEGGDERAQALRAAAADALGRVGARADAEVAAAAEAALREILTGEGPLGLGRAASTLVRQSALRALGSYPGPASAAVLQAYARAEDPAESNLALVVLRKAALADVAAVDALAAIATSAECTPERRTAALQALAGLGRGAAEAPLARARPAVREALQPSSPPDVRLEAARAAAALADPDAIELVAAFWKEDPSRPLRGGPFFDLLDAAARASDAQDGVIGRVLLGLVGTWPWDAVDALSAYLVQQHPRNALRRNRAQLLFDRAAPDANPPPSAEEARALLEASDQLLAAVLGPEPADGPLGSLDLRVRVQRRLGDLAPDKAAGKAHYLRALRLAARSLRVETARLGQDLLARLEDPGLAATLTDEERARVAEDRAAIEAVLR